MIKMRLCRGELRVSIWPRDSRVLVTLYLSTDHENTCLPVLPSRGRNVSDVSNLPFLTTSVTHLRSYPRVVAIIPYFQLSGCRTTHITHVNCSSIFFGVVSLPCRCQARLTRLCRNFTENLAVLAVRRATVCPISQFCQFASRTTQFPFYYTLSSSSIFITVLSLPGARHVE